jgi:hypothetical protein
MDFSRVTWKKLASIGSVSIFAGLVVLAYCIRKPSQPAVDLRPVTVLADCPDDAGVKLSASPKFAALSTTVVDPLVFATGVSGTYIVPRGYVVGFSAVASTTADAGVDGGTGGYATVTITPSGPNVGTPVAQPPIYIPAGLNYSTGRPVIQGNTNELGVGSIFVFSGTSTYTIVMSLGGT